MAPAKPPAHPPTSRLSRTCLKEKIGCAREGMAGRGNAKISCACPASSPPLLAAKERFAKKNSPASVHFPSMKQARLSKGERLVAPHNDVIEQFDSQELPCLPQSSRHISVRSRRGRIARGVIVHQDDAKPRGDNRCTKHLSWVKGGLVDGALCDHLVPFREESGVEGDHNHPLNLGIV